MACFFAKWLWWTGAYWPNYHSRNKAAAAAFSNSLQTKVAVWVRLLWSLALDATASLDWVCWVALGTLVVYSRYALLKKYYQGRFT